MIAVLKNKAKTPAQDRLLKVVKSDPAAVADLLKNAMVDFKPAAKNVLPKNYITNVSVGKSGNTLKSTDAVKLAKDVQPARAAKKIVHYAPLLERKWLGDFAPKENTSKIVSTITSDAHKSSFLKPSSFHPPANSKTTSTTTSDTPNGSVWVPSSFHWSVNSKTALTTAFDAPKKFAIVPASNGSQTWQSKSSHSDIIKKGSNVLVQNRLKINDNSKIIGGKWLSFDLI